MTDPLPLQGITVLDLSRFVAGPLCTFFPASLGAEVLAVEDVTPSPSRRLPPFAHPDGGSTSDPVDGALSVPFLKHTASGKHSIAITLGTDKGRGPRAPARVDRGRAGREHAPPGAMAASFGLQWTDTASRNPGLVYCSMSGYGHDGPTTERPRWTWPCKPRRASWPRPASRTDRRCTPKSRSATASRRVSPHSASSSRAIANRDRTGHGQHVDLAMLDVLTALVWDEPVDHYAAVGMPVRTGNADPRGAPIDAYECADGWVAVTLSSDQQWRGLCEAMGRLDLLEQLPTVRERAQHAADVDEAVSTSSAPRSADDVEQAFLDLGIAAARVRDPVAAADDPHLAARRLLEPLHHPAAGGKESGFLAPPADRVRGAGRDAAADRRTRCEHRRRAARRQASTTRRLASLRERGIVA